MPLTAMLSPTTSWQGERCSLAVGEPATSVDTKKKGLVCDFKNAGCELRPKGQPEPVRVHDVKIPELGRAAPYGVYNIAGHTGWVSVSIDHGTTSFAVNPAQRWRQTMGHIHYPAANSLLITADRGGGNGVRRRGYGNANCKPSPMNSA